MKVYRPPTMPYRRNYTPRLHRIGLEARKKETKLKPITPPSAKNEVINPLCFECRQPFKPRGPQQVYCSAKCRSNAGNRRFRMKSPSTRQVKCADCGMVIKRPNIKYCNACRKARAGDTPKRGVRREIDNCLICNTKFTPKRTNSVTCSPACQAEKMHRDRRLRRKNKLKKEPPITCKMCEVEFCALVQRTYYCSPDCAYLGRIISNRMAYHRRKKK